MRISFVPRYTESAASSRLRVFALAAAISRLGLASVQIGLDRSADVVFVQKADDPKVFSAVAGHPRVIYDYDDIWSPAALFQASQVARVFTSDTPGHAVLSESVRRAGGIRCELVPDPIDYAPKAPMPVAPARGLAWFGNAPNYESARALFETAPGRLCTIAERPVSESAVHCPWSYAEFPFLLRAIGTAFLSHSGADPAKSANKMVAAVTLGVPCIVQESPAYEELARAVGLEWSIVRTPVELREAYRRLQIPEERREYLARIQPVVWERYHVDAVARRFMEIVRSLS